MVEPTLSHLDAAGSASMVDVGDKQETRREASAAAYVALSPELLAMITAGGVPKGDVFGVARIAGIQAAKRTAELIPLCHPLPLHKVDVDFSCDAGGVHVHTRARTHGRTGVEMEALTAASVAALTIYDMCKAVDKGIVIERIQLLEKQGGKSGSWRRSERA